MGEALRTASEPPIRFISSLAQTASRIFGCDGDLYATGVQE
jgi:hypothetical protein